MSNLFRTNVRILRSERSGGHDRYGRPLRSAVPVSVHGAARLEKRTSYVTSVDGTTTTINGTLMAGRSVVLVEGDLVILSDDTQWVIFGVEESLDINGRVQFRTYDLTKKRVKV